MREDPVSGVDVTARARLAVDVLSHLTEFAFQADWQCECLLGEEFARWVCLSNYERPQHCMGGQVVENFRRRA